LVQCCTKKSGNPGPRKRNRPKKEQNRKSVGRGSFQDILPQSFLDVIFSQSLTRIYIIQSYK
jgi:hypothetical protein